MLISRLVYYLKKGGLIPERSRFIEVASPERSRFVAPGHLIEVGLSDLLLIVYYLVSLGSRLQLCKKTY